MKMDRITEFSTIALTFSIVFLVLKIIIDRRRWRSPPGPWGFPVIGHLLSLGNNPVIPLQKWYKEYGEIFKIKMGQWPTIFVLNRNAIKQALMLKGDEFSDRPDFYSFTKIGDQKSITSGRYCPRYLLQRKIATNVLRMFTGVRKNNPIDEIVQEEANYLVEEFLKQNGESFDPMGTIKLCSASVIYQVCYGRGVNAREDNDFVEIVKTSDDFFEFVKAGNPFDVLPWLRFLMPKHFRSFLQILARSDKLRLKKLKEHEETFDESHIRDAADGLISATKQYSNEQKAEVDLNDFYIKVVLGDFTGAGFDTTTSALNWLILFLASNPEIQREVRIELDDVIGPGRHPSIKDKDNLPFTEATILESLRMGSVAALAIPHGTTKDFNFQGYDISAGTVVFVNLYSIHYDPQLWENPKCFNPRRFLNENGQLNQKMIDQLVSFGIGRRRCPGESLARLELFLFFTNIIQKCTIELAPGENVDFEGEFALVHRPKPFKIIARRIM